MIEIIYLFFSFISYKPCHKYIKLGNPQDHRISAGTNVLNNLWSIQMDLDYYGDHETFHPERVLNPDRSLQREERLISFRKGKEALDKEDIYLSI